MGAPEGQTGDGRTPETCYKKSPSTAGGLDFRGRFGKLFWSILAYYS